jgi:hypothetical protein
VGLERGSLSLVSTTEELLGRISSGSGLENRDYGRGDPLRWPRDILCPQKMALTSPTCGSRSVGIVRLRTKTTEFFYDKTSRYNSLRSLSYYTGCSCVFISCVGNADVYPENTMVNIFWINFASWVRFGALYTFWRGGTR